VVDRYTRLFRHVSDCWWCHRSRWQLRRQNPEHYSLARPDINKSLTVLVSACEPVTGRIDEMLAEADLVSVASSADVMR
jgi:hypothetical protein